MFLLVYIYGSGRAETLHTPTGHKSLQLLRPASIEKSSKESYNLIYDERWSILLLLTETAVSSRVLLVYNMSV